MQKTAFLFPGQGSQYKGMGVQLYNAYSSCRQVFECASDILGYDLLTVCSYTDEKTLSQTIYAQPTIMAVSLAAFAAVCQKGIVPCAVAGHSLGEYAALVCSKSLSMEDGFRVIKARTAAMQQCARQQNGMMCAVLGAPAGTIEKICDETEGYVVAVNYNCPAQTVIAGEKSAVTLAMQKLQGTARRCQPLKVSAAFHSKLMQPAVDIFLDAIKDITLRPPKIDFYSNLTGKLLSGDTDIKKDLGKHLVSPVRFSDELFSMQENNINCFMELGPGKVLSGLVKKTLKNITVCNVQDTDSLQNALLTVLEER